ncbi:MAG: BON domain-containing protein [Burkholderiales bacterium]
MIAKHSVLAALMLLALLPWSGAAANADDKKVAMGPPSQSQNAPFPQMQDEQSVRTPESGAAPISSATLEAEINQALREGRLASVTARVADNLEVTLGGSVTSAAEKQRAFLIARAFKEVEQVKDKISIVGQSAADGTATPGAPSVASPPPGAKTPTKSNAPKDNATIRAKGSEKATRSKTPSEQHVTTASRSGAASQLPSAQSEQHEHAAAPQTTAAPPTSAALEAEINQALKEGKLATVTARVETNSEVTLRGSVASAAEKQRAFLIARSFKEVERVKDQVFVVEE